MSSQIPGAENDGEQEGQCSEDERAVALAHRAIVAPRRADEERGRSDQLARAGKHDHDHDERCRDAGDGGEGKVKCGVGEEVAEFVQECAEIALLAVFPGEHAVDGVEGHAHEEDDRDEKERQDRPRPQDEDGAGGKREDEGGDGDLVRGDAADGQRARERPEPFLECRLQVVDADHRKLDPRPRVPPEAQRLPRARSIRIDPDTIKTASRPLAA